MYGIHTMKSGGRTTPFLPCDGIIGTDGCLGNLLGLRLYRQMGMGKCCIVCNCNPRWLSNSGSIVPPQIIQPTRISGFVELPDVVGDLQQTDYAFVVQIRESEEKPSRMMGGTIRFASHHSTYLNLPSRTAPLPVVDLSKVETLIQAVKKFMAEYAKEQQVREEDLLVEVDVLNHYDLKHGDFRLSRCQTLRWCHMEQKLVVPK